MKRFLSCLLVAGMLLGLCVTTAFAADSDSSDTFSDVSSDTTSENWHWGGTAIERWADYDLVVGCGDGTFRPNNSMTRAEAAVVFAKLLGLTADDADLSFIADCTDVNESDWYAPYIALCYEYGIMAGTSTTSLTMNPTGTMSREMYMAMLVRVLKIAGADSIDEEAAGKSYSDADDVSDWAKKSVYALANLQYVSGTTTGEVGTLSAKSDMTRAEVMSLLNQTISAYTNSAYIEKTGGNTVTMETFDTGNGVTLIAAGNVKVTGSGDMFVAAGAAKGGTIEVTGTANTVINASDKTTVNFTVTEKESQVENTEIHGEDSSVNFIVPTGSSLTVASATSTGTGSITVSGAATAAAATITGENVTVTAANDSISVTADEATVTITESGLTVDGTASSVTTSGNTGTVTTASATISATTSAVTVAGTIATVEVTSDDATVTVADTATVNTVTVASSSEVTVDGTVSTVEVTSKDATVTVTDTATVETVTDSTSVTWNAPAFTWASDYSSATAAFTSTAGNTQTVTATVTSTTTAATSTAAGKTVYTATVTFNGITYINTKEVAIPATGHSY
ncbi:MAG: S-layer homology domain-containing protein, partial [Oscillospiraceae bacterium]|nr:S-layer homology domain-containing protein [Oscillospiraceae bacterium]